MWFIAAYLRGGSSQEQLLTSLPVKVVYSVELLLVLLLVQVMREWGTIYTAKYDLNWSGQRVATHQVR